MYFIFQKQDREQWAATLIGIAGPLLSEADLLGGPPLLISFLEA
jgi:hypothetical protein